jgi:hypothetical protein
MNKQLLPVWHSQRLTHWGWLCPNIYSIYIPFFCISIMVTKIEVKTEQLPEYALSTQRDGRMKEKNVVLDQLCNKSTALEVSSYELRHTSRSVYNSETKQPVEINEK